MFNIIIFFLADLILCSEINIAYGINLFISAIHKGAFDPPQGRAELIGLPAKIKVLVSSGLFDEAILDQRKLVDSLSILDGKNAWSTLAQSAYLLELEKVAKMGKEKRVKYLATLEKVANGVEKLGSGYISESALLLSDGKKELIEILGDKSLSVTTTLEQLGNVYLFSCNHEGAKRYFSLALENWKAIVGTAHPFIGNNLSSIGDAELMAGEFAHAESHFREALENERLIFGTKTLRYASRLVSLSDALIQNKKIQEATKYTLQGLSIVENTPEGAEWLAAYCQFNLGNINVANSDLVKAEANFEKALKLFDDAPLQWWSLLIRIYDNYIVVLKKQEKNELAEKAALRRSKINGDIKLMQFATQKKGG